MLKTILLISFVFSQSLLLSSCAHAPPDKPICIELDIARGWCTNTISGTEFYIDDAHPYSFSGEKKDLMTWWEMRPYMIYVPYSTWVEIKTFIIKICKSSGQCSGTVQSWDRTVERIDDRMEVKLP